VRLGAFESDRCRCEVTEKDQELSPESFTSARCQFKLFYILLIFNLGKKWVFDRRIKFDYLVEITSRAIKHFLPWIDSQAFVPDLSHRGSHLEGHKHQFEPILAARSIFWSSQSGHCSNSIHKNCYFRILISEKGCFHILMIMSISFSSHVRTEPDIRIVKTLSLFRSCWDVQEIRRDV